MRISAKIFHDNRLHLKFSWQHLKTFQIKMNPNHADNLVLDLSPLNFKFRIIHNNIRRVYCKGRRVTEWLVTYKRPIRPASPSCIIKSNIKKQKIIAIWYTKTHCMINTCIITGTDELLFSIHPKQVKKHSLANIHVCKSS